MTVIRVVRIDYDGMEKHDPLREKEIGIFGPKDGLSPIGNVTDWFAGLAPERLYVGAGEVYPKWRLESKELK